MIFRGIEGGMSYIEELILVSSSICTNTRDETSFFFFQNSKNSSRKLQKAKILALQKSVYVHIMQISIGKFNILLESCCF